MHYYSVSYKILPQTLPPEIKEIGSKYVTFLLFGNTNKLNDEGIKHALEYYLKDNKISYTELTITESKEITEREYLDRTQYT